MRIPGEKAGRSSPLADESSSPAERPIYRGEHGQWKREFAITVNESRNRQLKQLVTATFLQAGRRVAELNARLQYEEAATAPKSSLADHLAEFTRMWGDHERRWFTALTSREQQDFNQRNNDRERDAYRICRNWWRKAALEGRSDFFAPCQTLGDRLGIGWQHASRICRLFCAQRIMQLTQPYIIRQRANRYQWLAAEEPARTEAALITS